MRDRLSQLIYNKLSETCGECSSFECTEELTDYLLENGVIVPPCKVREAINACNKLFRKKGEFLTSLDAVEIAEALDDITAADVVEIKHGEWKWGKGLGGQYGIWCTNCGSGWVDSENAEWIAREHDYCGKCGAEMDGGKEE